VATASGDDPLRAADGSGAGIARALGLTTGLTAAAVLLHGAVHALPLGLREAPHDSLGWLTVAGMGLLYVTQSVLWRRPDALAALHRWAYAGFYLDAFFTRLALRGGDAPWRPAERRAPIGAATPASSVNKV
jgi:NAD(P)H-quinone oxidoreductase subunit 5